MHASKILVSQRYNGEPYAKRNSYRSGNYSGKKRTKVHFNSKLWRCAFGGEVQCWKIFLSVGTQNGGNESSKPHSALMCKCM